MQRQHQFLYANRLRFYNRIKKAACCDRSILNIFPNKDQVRQF